MALRDVDELVRRIAVDAPVATSPLETSLWLDLVARCRLERLEGAMLAGAESGRLRTTPEQHAQLVETVAATMESTVTLEALAIRSVTLLRDAGVEPCVLKGVASAHLDAERVYDRQFSDVDLLVRGEDLDHVYEILVRHGWRRRFPEPRRSFDRRYGKGAAFEHPEGWVLDIHRTLTYGALGLSVDLTDLWSDREPLVLGGTPVTALGNEQRFLHACVHVSTGRREAKFGTLRDMLHLLRSPMDLTKVRDLATRWRYRAVVRTALQELYSRLLPADVDEPVAALSDLDPSRRERWILGLYRSQRVGHPLRAASGHLSLRRPIDHLHYGIALTWPDRQYRRSSSTGDRRWHRLLSDLVTRTTERNRAQR